MTALVPKLRVGTLNTRALSGRLGTVLQLGTQHALDVFAVQETRVPEISVATVVQTAARSGWKCIMGPQGANVSGKPAHGTLVLTRWPSREWKLPSDLLPEGRGQAVALERPGERPLLLIVVYLPASDEAAAASMVHALMEYAAEVGEDVLLLGDFNLVAERWPVPDACATGRWRALDEQTCGDATLPGTHRNHRGVLTGRVLDFGLGTPGVAARKREQHRGPADHDLVLYDVVLKKDRDVGARLPLRRTLTTETVLEDRWGTAWTRHASKWAWAVEQHDLTHAWAALSDAAEDALAVEGLTQGQSRSTDPQPQMTPLTSTKAPTFQSHAERRLRRLARRAHEACAQQQAGRLSAQLARKLVRDAAEKGWNGLDFDTIEARAEEEANKLAEAAAASRLQRWKHQVQTDHHRLSKWITRVVLPATPMEDADEPLGPQQILEAERGKWEALWTRAAGDPSLGEPAGEPAAQLDAASLQPTAEDLERSARRLRGKARGMDGWGDELLALPRSFWELVAQLWGHCVCFGEVPAQWRAIKAVLIPKPEGGRRPISVASAVWRVVAGAVAKKLRAWTQEWIAPGQCGAVPGRHAGNVHDQLHSSLRSAALDGKPLVGVKADLAKAFDSICTQQALAVAVHFGFPRSLAQVIKSFYDGQRRYLTYEGEFARTGGTRATRGLLQGCPLSPLLLNLVTALWCRAVARVHNGVITTVYLDDRTLWSTAPSAVEDLVASTAAGRRVDAHFGLSLHPDKTHAFGTTPGARQQLKHVEGRLGTVVDRFRLLGVHYYFGKPCGGQHADLTAKIRTRCNRIGMAARLPSERRRLLRELVMTMMEWAGPWQCYRRSDIKTWTSLIERAVWGGRTVSGRSPFLFWNVLARPCLHPDYAIALSALRYEWQRTQCPTLEAARSQPPPNFAAAAVELGIAVCEGGGWRTRQGDFLPGRTSWEAVRRSTERHWREQQWKADPKTAGARLGSRTPCLAALRQLAENPRKEAIRAATAAAVDARALARQRDHNPEDLVCQCGLAVPDRTHLTFRCPAQERQATPGDTQDERLLHRLVDYAPVLIPFEDDLDDEMVQAVAELRGAGRPLVATDGGCLVRAGRELWQKASWGFAIRAGSALVTCGGHVPGGEQTPAAGEREALLQAVRYLHAAGLEADLVLDNQALVKRLTRGLARDSWGGALPRYWAEIRSKLARGSRVLWVPSHGKQPQWTAPDGWPGSADIRGLNDVADRVCLDQLVACRPAWERACEKWDAATSWSRQAVTVQMEVTRPFFEKCRSIWGNEPGAGDLDAGAQFAQPAEAGQSGDV